METDYNTLGGIQKPRSRPQLSEAGLGLRLGTPGAAASQAIAATGAGASAAGGGDAAREGTRPRSRTRAGTGGRVLAGALTAGDRVRGAPQMARQDPPGGRGVTAVDGVDQGTVFLRALVAFVLRFAHRHQDRVAE